MIRILIAFLCIFQVSSTLQAQTVIDSLISVYPNQKDAERAITLGELCYQLANNDSKKSIYYGKLSYEAAKRSKDQVIVAQALNDWSIPYLIQGNFDSVLVLCNKALEIRTELGDSVGVGKLLNKMSNANYELGNLSVSLEQNLRALKIFESNELFDFAARISANIGSLYEQNGMLEDGLLMYQKAKSIAKKNDDSSAYFKAQIAEATCIAKLNRFTESDRKLNEALDYFVEQDDIEMMGICYQNLGFNARLNKSLEKGKSYYEKSLEMYRINSNEPAIALVIANLAQISMDLQQLDTAEEYLIESMEIANTTKSLHLLENTYRGFIRLENLRGNFQEADRYFELYTDKMDSLYNSETNLAISEMKVKYDTDAKAKELENQQLVNKNNRLLLIIAFAVIGILTLVILLIRYRKKRQSEQLEIQGLKNLEVERKRIARDLHDNLGAELVLISSKIDAVAFKNKDEQMDILLDGIGEISTNASHQLRETIWSIHKSSISIEELAMKVGNYAERIGETSKLEIHIETESPETMLSPALGLHLFRMCQEMMNNTIKYAEAKRIDIEFKPNELSISDDGKGFDVKSVRRGYGLNNLEERTNEINGEMMLSSDENGTKFQVRF